MNFQIDEDLDERIYREHIMNFQQFLKHAMGIMEIQKNHIKNMMKTRQKMDKAQVDLLVGLMKFEDVGIAYYADVDQYQKRILTHADKSDL